MRVIGMISGTSFDAIEAVAAELELDGQTLVADLRGPRVGRVSRPSLHAAIARDRCLLRRRPSRQVCRLDTAIGQRFAEVAAELAADVRSTATVDVMCSHGQTVFHWVEGAQRARDAAARPAGVHRRADGCDGRRRRARAGHRRRRARRAAREPARRAPARQRIPTACAARSTSAGSRTSPSSARAASRSPTTSARPTPWSTPSSPPRPAAGRPSTRGGARAARGTVDAELLARVPRRAVLRRSAAEVDRQGAVPPRLRAGARRRPRDRDRRPARDADRALGRDGRRRPEAGSRSPTLSRRAGAPATRR